MSDTSPDVAAATPPPTYDYSGLPAGRSARESGPQSSLARMLLLTLLCIGGLAIAFGGSVIAAIGTHEVAKTTAQGDPLSAPPVPELPNLILVELGHIVAILGGLLCAVGVGLAVWNALRGPGAREGDPLR